MTYVFEKHSGKLIWEKIFFFILSVSVSSSIVQLLLKLRHSLYYKHSDTINHSCSFLLTLNQLYLLLLSRSYSIFLIFRKKNIFIKFVSFRNFQTSFSTELEAFQAAIQVFLRWEYLNMFALACRFKKPKILQYFSIPINFSI